MNAAALPTFSVIIPVFNGARTLARAIDSVLNQSALAHEIIVVDDASSDDTPEIAKAYGGKIRSLRFERNQGVSAARNHGARAATGSWLAFLDADDWYFPDRIKAHLQWISEDPELDFLTADYEYQDANGELIGRSLEQHAAGRSLLNHAKADDRAVMEVDLFEAFVSDHFGDTHTLSLPKASFDRIGGYPLGFKVCEDVHFLTRLVARSRRVGVICRPLAVYVVHNNSATRRDPVAAQVENVRTLKALKRLAPAFSPAVRRGVNTRVRIGRLNLAYALHKAGRRADAIRAVLPSLIESPSLASVRDLLSIVRG